MRVLGIGWIAVVWLLLLSGCTQQPQQVRRMNSSQTADSALLAQMEFNMQMASAADKLCSDWVKNDSVAYAMDEFGFWYAKTINQHADTLQKGEKVLTHIQIQELNGILLADIKDYFTVGSSDLPIALQRCLRQMALDEEMRIVSPWYTAYGAEGTTLIKPYSNLIITLTTIKE